MATPMQQAFAKSGLYRRLMYSGLISEGLPVTGYKRLFNSIFAEIAEPMPEPQIKLLLFEFLQCYDITAEEQAEALKLLQLSQTTLTNAQREIFYNRLYE